MTESMSTTTKSCPRSRATAFLGLVALALLQVSVAAHQFEHSADHGFSVCDVCTAYSELDDAPPAGATTTDYPIAPGSAVDTFSNSPNAALFVAAYRSRAPPLS